jgi:hypothetical protein
MIGSLGDLDAALCGAAPELAGVRLALVSEGELNPHAPDLRKYWLVEK